MRDDAFESHSIAQRRVGRLVGDNPGEPVSVEHMNGDHSDAVANYAAVFGKARGDEGWVMTGIDADGFDLAAGDKVLRIFFKEPLADAPDMHKTLVAMAIEARQPRATIGPD